MLGYCETTKCRRQVLLGYFGEELPAPCGNCDTCREGVETWDGTLAAQKALSCAYRTGQMFGVIHLIDVLVGKDTEKIRKFQHDRLSVYGVGKELSETEWRSVFRQLVAAGMMKVDMGNKGGLRLTAKCSPIMKGQQVFELRKDRTPGKISRRRTLAGPVMAKDKGQPTISPSRRELWNHLRSLRQELARRLSLPAYVIFHDSTLTDLTNRLPDSLQEMRNVQGIGEKKLQMYGGQFLEVIRRYKEENHLP
jgi:ATP-dependent DNA helicase RecQ